MRTKALPFIILILVGGTGTSAAAPDDPGFAKQWNMRKIGIPSAWTVGNGEGVTIAVVDTGVNLAHPDLASKIVQGKNFVQDGRPPDDDNGHGTHVAGIAAALANNARGVVGVAPGARIMPVKVLDARMRGFDATEAIRWAVDHGADIINLSFSGSLQGVTGPPFDEAVRYAWSKGVICVAAAGNTYLFDSGYADDPVVVVTATNRHDRKPHYANAVGQAKWGIAAPGGGGELDPKEDRVFSTWRHNRYAYNHGTSMAAPHVAGAAAILRGLGLTPEQTVSRLLATAKDLGRPGWDSTFGAGRLDVAAAVSATHQTSSSPAPSWNEPEHVR